MEESGTVAMKSERQMSEIAGGKIKRERESSGGRRRDFRDDGEKKEGNYGRKELKRRGREKS